MISEKVLKDSQAVSVAEAVAVANEVAREAGIYDRPVQLSIQERTTEDGTAVWRISYMPVPPPGIFTRGGDYLVEVNAQDGTVYRVLFGQ